jgi:O-succinylbenzoate synthase
MKFRLQFRRYRLPLKAAVRTGRGVMVEREGVIVRLAEAEGERSEEGEGVGFGEAAPLAWFGCETVDEIEAACRALGGIVDEEALAGVPERLACLRGALAEARRAIGGGNAAEAGRGRVENPPYLSVAALVPAGRAAVQAVARRGEAGFRTFKWKVGVGDVADELALLDDVCAALPDGAKLRLDANGVWDRRRAERWLERCAERPVEFVEQPCLAGSTEGAAGRRWTEDVLSGLAADYPTPIALDESVAGDGDVERWLGAGWRGVFVIKPSLHADMAAAMAKLTAAGARVVFSSALETAVGAKAALRHAFAWTGERKALGFGVWPLFAEARFDGPAAAAFLRWEDVERIDAEAVWNALS